MRIVLFVNDSHYSYLQARPTIEKYHGQVEAIFFSTRIRGSSSRIREVLKKTYLVYFLYRSLIEVLTRLNAMLGRKSVAALARKYGIRTYHEPDVNNSDRVKALLPGELGMAFNFDQVLSAALIGSFRHGITNIHGSRLPRDKGVSPVLWAFARGDDTVWSTVYSMDGGIDSGPVYRQSEIPVRDDDTAFSLNSRVCEVSALELVDVVGGIMGGGPGPVMQDTSGGENYWGWPDDTHRDMMKRAGRRLMNLRDILDILR